MTNVTRIKQGPHPTPRPSRSGEDPNTFVPDSALGKFERLPLGAKGRLLLGAAALAATATAFLGIANHTANQQEKIVHERLRTAATICDPKDFAQDRVEAGQDPATARELAEGDAINCKSDVLTGPEDSGQK